MSTHSPAVRVSTNLLANPVYLALMRTSKGRSALAMWQFLRLAHCRDVSICGGVADRFPNGLSQMTRFVPGSTVDSWRGVFALIAATCDMFGEEHWVAEDGRDLVLAAVRDA